MTSLTYFVVTGSNVQRLSSPSSDIVLLRSCDSFHHHRLPTARCKDVAVAGPAVVIVSRQDAEGADHLRLVKFEEYFIWFKIAISAGPEGRAVAIDALESGWPL